MKTILCVVIVIFAFVLMLTVAAGAQYKQSDEENHISVGFGIYHPVDPTLRSLPGQSDKWVVVKAAYILSRDAQSRPDTFVSLQFISPSDSFSRTRMMPITINKVFRPRQEKLGSFYVTGGVGVCSLKIRYWNGAGSTTSLAYTIGGGVELSPSSRLDLTYNWAKLWGNAVSYNKDNNPMYPKTTIGFSFSGFALTYTAEAF